MGDVPKFTHTASVCRKMPAMTTNRRPDGELDLGDLPRRWQQCDQMIAQARRSADQWERKVLSPRSVDEGQVGAHRAYASAERYLAVADENHEALVSLLQHHGATPTAPWNLLRPTFEASFKALWLLHPEDSVMRRRRGVQLEWQDDEASRKFTNLVLNHFDGEIERARRDEERDSRENTETYAHEADQLGLKYRSHDKTGKKIPPSPPRLVVANELATLIDDREVQVALTTTWATLSGIQHAEGSSMLRVSDRRTVGTYPGGERLYMTINDSAFSIAAGATTLLRVLAWSRYGACHRPIRSSVPVDLSPLRDIARRALDG